MLSKIYSGAVVGISPILIECEVDSRNGLAGQTIVGLPDAAVKESKERLFSAIKNSGYEIPLNKYITFNLAPADIKKAGSFYDLPMAIGLLVSTSQIISEKFKKILFVGELGLDGELKPVNGGLLFAILAKERGFKAIMLPEKNAEEASLIKDIQILPITSLFQAVEYLEDRLTIVEFQQNKLEESQIVYKLDMVDVKGQAFAKRAMEIAAAGGHNLFMIGPPGCGKSMLAKRLPTILPDLAREELLEVIKIYSVTGKLKRGKLFKQRPFRSPHHTVSYAGMIGGTSQCRPGEISLAHRGVLYLDEIPEFERRVLETLRQPLEDGKIVISRAMNSFEYPARFMLIASANPCPCGYLNHPTIACKCRPAVRNLYTARISGPLLDRFDMLVELEPLSGEELLSRPGGESSQEIKQRVILARKRQSQRLGAEGALNANMSESQIESTCILDDKGKSVLAQSIGRFAFSARQVARIKKVARSIADLEESEMISSEHLLEAIQFRKNQYAKD